MATVVSPDRSTSRARRPGASDAAGSSSATSRLSSSKTVSLCPALTTLGFSTTAPDLRSVESTIFKISASTVAAWRCSTHLKPAVIGILGFSRTSIEALKRDTARTGASAPARTAPRQAPGGSSAHGPPLSCSSTVSPPRASSSEGLWTLPAVTASMTQGSCPIESTQLWPFAATPCSTRPNTLRPPDVPFEASKTRTRSGPLLLSQELVAASRQSKSLPEVCQGAFLQSSSADKPLTGTKATWSCLKPVCSKRGVSKATTAAKRSCAHFTSSILVTATSSRLAPRPLAMRNCSRSEEVPPPVSLSAPSSSRPLAETTTRATSASAAACTA
mmetsp:Transcript_1163/g.1968  ORF Transcript_1163/g.1968 Transcript_1163/m.1968 type:complete len:331 (-) Transcript_1163:2070-3062(-)